ncbi:MAG: hypothetical protein JNK49_13165 [Planctomycetes bacterium]|nr:hypothetical protein [Planctomycetota bacterium]
MSRCALFPMSLVLALAAACATPKPRVDLLSPSEAQTKLRAIQSRTFELPDRLTALRGVMAVLQDLGFVIERANEALGLVTGARFAEPNYFDVVAITVTVRPQDGGKFLVRVNAIYNNKPIDTPEVYQNFFAALERSLFVERG